MVVDKNAIIEVNLSPKFSLGPLDHNSLLILMIRVARNLFFEPHSRTKANFTIGSKLARIIFSTMICCVKLFYLKPISQ